MENIYNSRIKDMSLFCIHAMNNCFVYTFVFSLYVYIMGWERINYSLIRKNK